MTSLPSSDELVQLFKLPSVKEVSICWENINVSTKQNRVLLRDISGAVLPGQLVALMGASGAGKTTLLNTLLQRNLKGLNVTGDVLLEGRPIQKAAIGSVSAYIQQEDLFIGTLTVREHLTMQAHLRLHSKMSRAARIYRVDAVISELELQKSQFSRIGVPGLKKGISGGEAKRLSFASEILANPSLLFCDEPTTGLDSYMAEQVVSTLSRMARKGRTIICTIHQPASEVFGIFDKVFLLALGRVAYFGPTPSAYKFFADCGVQIPAHSNPADIYIHNLAVIPDQEDECREKITKICDIFEQSEYAKDIGVWTAECKARNKEVLVGRGRVPVFRRFATLFTRSFLDNLRNPSLFRAKIVQKIFMGFFMGFLFFDPSHVMLNQDTMSNLKGALFYYISELTYATTFGVQTFMPADFPMVVREYNDGIYPISLYYLAKFFSYLPLFTIDGILLVSISYYLMGLEANIFCFLRTIFTCMLIEWSVLSVGYAVSACAPSYAIAVSISGPLLSVFSITGGLFTNISKMPAVIRWIQYLSWFRFGYESLIVNEFKNKEKILCTDTDGHEVEYCEENGQQVIDNLYFHDNNMYFNWLCMFFYIIMIHFVGYNGLLIRAKLAR